MTRKELKQYIKTKAKDVEVKDFSKAIMNRVQNNPQTSYEAIKEPKRSWRINPFTTSLMTIFTAFIIVLVLINQNGGEVLPEAPVLENLEDVVALSTVQATSLIEVMDAELNNTSETILLRFGPQERNDLIQDELSDLARYLETIEKLYASNENFDVIDEVQLTNGYGRRIRFRTRDFTNQEADYEIDYNQSFNAETNRFKVLGKISLGDKNYDLEVNGTKGNQSIQMTVKKDDLNYVILDYQVIEGVDTYTVELIKNDQSIEKVTIALEQTDDEKIATLSFIEGQSTGTYTFNITQEGMQKIIAIHYAIDFDGDLEEGNIVIRVLTLQQMTMYSIVVQPEGRMPFTFTRGRFATQNFPQTPQNI